MIRFFSFLLMFAALFPSNAFSSESGSLEITFLNAGYADAAVIRSPEGRTVLLDSGDVEKPALVADFLREKGIKELDLVIISHPHKNHFGALFQVLDEVKVREIVWNGDTHQEEPFQNLLNKIQKQKILLRTVRAGDCLDISPALHFKVFHPADEMTVNINNNALVLKMIYGKASVLFMTDVGVGVQERLIKKSGKKLSSTIVQIPHHGGPLSEKFIKFFKPDFFVLSTGPNEWGLPREEQIAKLKAPVLRTDRDGNLVFQSDGKRFKQQP